MKKVFYNPKIKDKVTVLKTGAETNNKYILLEVELAPGGGNERHYHTTFNETFIPVQGVLGVDVEKQHYGYRALIELRLIKMRYIVFIIPVMIPFVFV